MAGFGFIDVLFFASILLPPPLASVAAALAALASAAADVAVSVLSSVADAVRAAVAVIAAAFGPSVALPESGVLAVFAAVDLFVLVVLVSAPQQWLLTKNPIENWVHCNQNFPNLPGETCLGSILILLTM